MDGMGLFTMAFSTIQKVVSRLPPTWFGPSWWVGRYRTSTLNALANWTQGQTFAPWLMGSKTMLSPGDITAPFLKWKKNRRAKVWDQNFLISRLPNTFHVRRCHLDTKNIPSKTPFTSGGMTGSLGKYEYNISHLQGKRHKKWIDWAG